MYNYTNFFIDKLKALAAADTDLSAILLPANIGAKNPNREADFPTVVVQTIQNEATGHTFTKEARTDIGIQIDVSCMDMIIEGVATDAADACWYISTIIGNYLEDVLRLSRVTQTDPIPIDIENQIFDQYLRYRMQHDLLNNIISK